MPRVSLGQIDGEVDIFKSPTLLYWYTQITFQPNRDGSLDNSVLVHEMTHGITKRMTGGGTATCLEGIESQGLGEGWSDAMTE